MPLLHLAQMIERGVAVGSALIRPGDDEASVCQGCHGAVELVTGCCGVDQELGSRLDAVGSEQLPAHGPAAGIAASSAIISPGDDKASIRQDRDGAVGLDAGCRGVDEEFRAERMA